MKRLLLILIAALFCGSLFANPCFEELENASFTTILCRTSVPELSLQGVTFVKGDDEIIPKRIIYSDSDLSNYFSALNTKPEISSIWESAMYSLTQRGATMQKTKEKLKKADYKKGDCLLNGTVDITSKSKIKKLEFLTSGSLDSVDVDCTVDLTLKKGLERYIIKGTFNIKGDKNKVLEITSEDVTVNGKFYLVSVKYQLTKAN